MNQVKHPVPLLYNTLGEVGGGLDEEVVVYVRMVDRK